MKKYLFISNTTKPNYEQQISREKVRLSDSYLLHLETAMSLGYKVYLGVNRQNPEELDCDYEVEFYDSSTYRSLFDIKSNYRAYKNLNALLKKENIDVIHCNTPIGGIMGRLCGKRAKVRKIIYTAHGFHFYKGAPLINRTVYRWAEMWMAHYTDVLITINQEDYQLAQKFRLRKGGKVYHVQGVGVDTKAYQLDGVNKRELRNSLGLKDDDIVLIAMGDLIARKNYAVSIKAIAQEANPKVHFMICGRGPETDSLKKLAKELGVENRIHFMGFRTDIKELLTISDIFLFTTYQEGLPRSMMEAMVAGLPCIASKIRGNIDLIEDGKGGYLRGPDDVEGFAQAIDSLVQDETLRKKMGRSNLETIKQYDTENIRSEIKKIYETELP